MAPFEKVNIPQKPPMVMVDRLVEIVGKMTVTAFLIMEDNVFCEDGTFREPGLIENMAQTAAAGVGSGPGIESDKAPVGFIGGIRNLKINDLPKVGQEIITRVTVMHEIFDATIVQGDVFLNDQLIASCELKIFLIKEE
jgi:3-hydroxymyristoyl/3-hydroxydecanoyl-(acyl carrier protein) dehydratase